MPVKFLQSHLSLPCCHTQSVDVDEVSAKKARPLAPMDSFVYTLTLSVLWRLLSSADNLCKQFGTTSGLTKCRSWSGFKLFDTLLVVLKECFEKVNFENSQQTTTKAWKITQHAKSSKHGWKFSGLILNSVFWGWLSKESQHQNTEFGRL